MFNAQTTRIDVDRKSFYYSEHKPSCSLPFYSEVCHRGYFFKTHVARVVHLFFFYLDARDALTLTTTDTMSTPSSRVCTVDGVPLKPCASVQYYTRLKTTGRCKFSTSQYGTGRPLCTIRVAL